MNDERSSFQSGVIVGINKAGAEVERMWESCKSELTSSLAFISGLETSVNVMKKHRDCLVADMNAGKLTIKEANVALQRLSEPLSTLETFVETAKIARNRMSTMEEALRTIVDTLGKFRDAEVKANVSTAGSQNIRAMTDEVSNASNT